MPDVWRLVAVDAVAPGWGAVPPLVDVAHELVAPDKHVAGRAVVVDEGLEAAGVVQKGEGGVLDQGRIAAFQD